MLENTAPVERAPVDALKDEETFLQWAGHVKLLYLRRLDRDRQHTSRRATITHQIEIFESLLDELAVRSARCRAMWFEVKKELELLKAPPGTG
jgi:hypothetical protein